MSDAVVLVHPPHREALLPFLDLEDDDDDDDDDSEESEESEENDGVYAEELEDGSFLLYTFQPFAIFAENQDEARTWLAQLGAEPSAIHDDPRGFLFFPDTIEPDAQTYDGIVAETAGEGIFVQSGDSPLAAAIAGIDPNLLQALAEQLIEGIQGQMLASLGGAGEGDGERDEGEDEDEDEDEDEHDDKPKP